MDNQNIVNEPDISGTTPNIREKIRKIFTKKMFIALIILAAIITVTEIVNTISNKPDFTSVLKDVESLLNTDLGDLIGVLGLAETIIFIGSFIRILPILLTVAGAIMIFLACKRNDDNNSLQLFVRGSSLMKWFFLIQDIKITLFQILTLILGVVSIIGIASGGGDVLIPIILIVVAMAVIIGVLSIISIYYTNYTAMIRALPVSYTRNKNILQVSTAVIVMNYLRIAIAVIDSIIHGGWINTIILCAVLVLSNLVISAYKNEVGQVDEEARKEYIEQIKQAKLARKAKR